MLVEEVPIGCFFMWGPKIKTGINISKLWEETSVVAQ